MVRNKGFQEILDFLRDAIYTYSVSRTHEVQSISTETRFFEKTWFLVVPQFNLSPQIQESRVFCCIN
jgi:hypothetical protein